MFGVLFVFGVIITGVYSDITIIPCGNEGMMGRSMNPWEHADLTAFLHTTVDEFGNNIGWIKWASCYNNVYVGPAGLIDGSTFIYHYASSFKIVPIDKEFEDEYTVRTVTCSNPIWALNHEMELSYELDDRGKRIGLSNLDNWIGSDSAKARLVNTCYEGSVGDNYSRRIYKCVYQSCGNAENGMHIWPERDVCTFDWSPNTETDTNLEMFIGFVYVDTNCPSGCVASSAYSKLPSLLSESENENENEYLKMRLVELENQNHTIYIALACCLIIIIVLIIGNLCLYKKLSSHIYGKVQVLEN